MEDIRGQDLDYLAGLMDRLTNPAYCLCPGCRHKRGEVPLLTEEQMYRLEDMLQNVSLVVCVVAQSDLSVPTQRQILEARIRAVVMYAYCFGVDNARGEP